MLSRIIRCISIGRASCPRLNRMIALFSSDEEKSSLSLETAATSACLVTAQ